jgi:hypothetical protein
MQTLRRLVRLVFIVLVVYASSEIGYRLYRYHKLLSAKTPQLTHASSSFESPLDIFDSETGFAYKPNTHVHQRLYGPDGTPTPHVSSIVTNNFGLISAESSGVPKSRTEFRIAVIGDSFSATTTSSLTCSAQSRR